MLVLFSVPLSVVVGITGGGWWSFFTPAYIFGAVPVLDQLIGLDVANPDENQENQLKNKSWLNGWLYLWLPCQLGVLLWALVHLTGEPRSTLETVGLVLSLGIMAGGGGINVAHEFMHRKSPFERALAEVLMGAVTYSHFCVEHVLGHHKHVATPQDPATSRMNESIFAFLPRTLWGTLKSSWSIETARVRQQGLQGTLKDRRVRYTVSLLAVYLALWGYFGFSGVVFFAAQSFVAVVLLEIINYVEHYGLVRQTLENGRYERVAPKHSWNSAHALTGSLLLNLPRHADHHHRASRPYMVLRHLDNSPIARRYSAMVLLRSFRHCGDGS